MTMPSIPELIQFAVNGERVVILSRWKTWLDRFLFAQYKTETKFLSNCEIDFPSGGSLIYANERRRILGLRIDRIAVLDLELDEKEIIDLKYRCKELHR